jgi:2-amino-4-hydroxy-6-hydroxymethyldihydropteridine diphosphokinase
MPDDKRIYLSLGSNLGDRAANIDRAIFALPGAEVRLLRRSSLYATEPVDFPAQQWFLNCVVEAGTSLMPRQLLHALQEIERQLGRRRQAVRGPRLIDLDILFYGASVIRTPELEVPHPRMAGRRFVLVPLAELAPALRHPSLGATVAELLSGASPHGAVRVWTPGSSVFAGPNQVID